MKKKLWCTAWILTGLMIGGCSAEQGGEPDSEIAQESQRETMETSENKASEMINTEESDKAVLEIPTLEIPTIGIVSEKKDWYTDDGETLLLSASADKVTVENDGYDALNAALSGQWGGLTEDYEELLQTAKGHYESEKDQDYYFMNYYINESVAVYRIDDRIASFCTIYNDYEGGAHGFYAFDGATFDVESGKKMQLEDILSDAEGFYDKAVSYITQ